MGAGIKGLFDLQVKAINDSGSSVLIRAANPADVSGIAGRYHSIQMEQKDINPESLKSFMREGGMFQVPSKDKILKECQPEQVCFAVAQGKNTIPEATIRFDTNIDIYRPWHADSPALLSYVELIVKSDYEYFAYPFLYSVFGKLLLAGYKTLLYQVYCLSRLDDAGVSMLLNFDNHASIGLHNKLGAVCVGSLPEKILPYGEKLLHIRPDVYSLDIAKATEKLNDLCQLTKWRLQT